MKSTLLNYLMSLFDNDTVDAMAGNLGENQSNITAAIKSLVPSVMGGIINKAGSSATGAQQIMDMATTAANNSPWNNIAGAISGGTLNSGESLLGDLLGNSGVVNALTNHVTGTTGLKTSSTATLLKWVSPLVLSGLGKFIANKGLNLSSLGALFNTERADIMSAIPSGLGLFSDAKSAANNIGHTASATTSRAAEYVEEQKKSNIWLPLILLALLAGILWWAMKGCNKESQEAAAIDSTTVTTETTTTTTTNTDTTSSATTTERTLGEVVLANGVKLQAYAGGIEDQIVQFIGTEEYMNASEEQLKSKWFNFDDLNFEFGTTKLTAASQRQLDNIVAILKAYPEVKMKIGAYTDKKGDDAANMKLSQSRADAVKAAISKAGVGAQITGAEGYGEKFATIDENASDEQRQVDRKTAIRLAK